MHKNRLIYLDNLRSMAMVLGIFVHVGTLGNFRIYGDVFEIVSEYFRMSLFFMLSGYFGALMLERRPARVFLRQRMINLAVPLLTCLVFLNPITLWLIFRYHNMAEMPDFSIIDVFDAVTGRIKAQGPLIWHLHLWFLFSLIFFVFTAPLLRYPVQWLAEIPAVRRMGDTVSGGPLLWLITATMVVMVEVAVGVNKLITFASSDFWLVRATLSYWPYYLLGMFLYWTPSIWAKVHRVDAVLVCFSVLGVLLIHRLEIGGVLGSVASLAVKTLVRCTIVFALLVVFSKLLDRSTRVSTELSDSIYTVYLLHFFIIYFLANLWILFFDMNGAVCWLIVIVTFLLAYGFHCGIVRNAPLVRLCLNGKVIPT